MVIAIWAIFTCVRFLWPRRARHCCIAYPLASTAVRYVISVALSSVPGWCDRYCGSEGSMLLRGEAIFGVIDFSSDSGRSSSRAQAMIEAGRKHGGGVCCKTTANGTFG